MSTPARSIKKMNIGRLSVAVTGAGKPVGNLVGDTKTLRVRIGDRAANGEAFAGEHVVRLPRSMTRAAKWESADAVIARLDRWTWGAA